MNETTGWYVVKQPVGYCDIISTETVEVNGQEQTSQDIWGPFPTQAEAIARRVGLIRAGKCQPI